MARNLSWPCRGNPSPRWGGKSGTEYVNEDKQAHPDHVHEVPVPGGGLEAEGIVVGEVALQGPQPLDQQHEGAEGHVGAAEAGEHEEGGAKDAGYQGQATYGVS